MSFKLCYVCKGACFISTAREVSVCKTCDARGVIESPENKEITEEKQVGITESIAKKSKGCPKGGWKKYKEDKGLQ